MRSNKYSQEDYAQECKAYMDIKQFLSNRITEQDKEIKLLKDLVFYHSSKHIEMYEWLNNINNMISNKGNPADVNINKMAKKKDHRSLNSSEDFVDSLSFVDDDIVSEENLDKLLNDLKNENLELTKKNEILNSELLIKNLELTKLSTDKCILFNELTELINSLKRIDMNLLNKFYRDNSNPVRHGNEIASALGIKYNIMSTQSQLSNLISKDLENRRMEKLRDNVGEYEKTNINSDKYMSILQEYIKDFQCQLNPKHERKN
jgi:hypothetical protein